MEEPQVGGHAVAGLEQHHVPGHELPGVNAEFVTIATHGGFSSDHSRERLDGFFGLGLLEKTDDGVKDHDAENDRRIHPLAEEGRDANGQQQDVNERLVELLDKLQPRRRASPGRTTFGPNFACRRLISSEVRPFPTSTSSRRRTSAEWT